MLFISKGGRHTLIQATFFSKPTYYLFLFCAPSVVLKHMVCCSVIFFFSFFFFLRVLVMMAVWTITMLTGRLFNVLNWWVVLVLIISIIVIYPSWLNGFGAILLCRMHWWRKVFQSITQLMVFGQCQSAMVLKNPHGSLFARLLILLLVEFGNRSSISF